MQTHLFVVFHILLRSEIFGYGVPSVPVPVLTEETTLITGINAFSSVIEHGTSFQGTCVTNEGGV